MSLKKRILDRADARDVILSKEVTATHTENLMLRPHRARAANKNARKSARKKARERGKSP